MKASTDAPVAPSIEPPRAVYVACWELLIGDSQLVLSHDACRILGLEPPVLPGSLEILFSLVHPEDVASLRGAYDRAMRDDAGLDVACRIAHPDGAVRQIQLRAQRVDARLWGTMQDVTDHGRISGLVRASEVAHAVAEEARAQAARILESISDAFVALDTTWRYTHVNRKAASIFGRTPEQMIGRHIWTEFPEGIGQPFYHAYHRAMAERQFVYLEEYYAPYDRWFENRIHPSPDGIAIFFNDVTDRKRAEQKRHESEDRFRQLADGLSTTLESITDAFYTLDLESRFTYVNHEAERLMVRTRAELLGKVVWDVFPDAVNTEFHRQFARAMTNNTVVKFEEYYAPLERWFEVRAFPSEQGLAVYFLDVTERRRVLEELREGEETLRQRTQQLDMALEIARLGVWSWDLASNMVTTIQGDGPACGLPEGVYPSTGDAFEELVHPDDRGWVTERLREAAATGSDYRAEFRIIAPDRSVRWISSHGEWTRDANGAPIVMIGADLDITERRQAANELRTFALRLESVQDAERSAIAREVHDDLGQALTVLRMDSSRLARMSATDAELSALVKEMTEVIDSTLQRTRSIALALHPTALDDLGLAAAIEIHVKHLVRRAGLVATLELSPVSARVDRERARAAYRVLQESLTNVVRHADARNVTIRLAERDTELVLEVSDDGCGIQPGQLAGAGSLGLLGMRERAAAFNGTVVVAAQEPCGTKVTFRLPLEPRPTRGGA